jgi:hypothetical protein
MFRIFVIYITISLTFFTRCTENKHISAPKVNTKQVTTVRTGTNEQKKGAVIFIRNQNINAGKIEQNTPLMRDVYYLNRGDESLIISNVRTSCNCTVASFSKTPLMPGDSAKIVLELDTENKGEYHKIMAVYSNAVNDYDSTINSSRILVKVQWNVVVKHEKK